MRVAHVTDVYLPALGGIELHVADLARRQAERGDDVSVLTYNAMSRERSDVIEPSGVRVVRMPLGAAGRLDLRQFDQIHAHVSAVSPLASMLAARASRDGVPTLATVHSLWRGLGPLPALSAATFGLRSAPVVWTAVSHAAAEVAQRWLPGESQVGVLPNAVDLSARAHTLQPGPGDFVRLVSTMRLVRLKRPLPLLRMFAAVSRRVSQPVQLTLIGDGGQRRAVDVAIRARGLTDSVWLPGRLDRLAVQSILAAADIYVAPAPQESFGLAVLEARCIGLPVVAMADSGVAEFVVHGRDGLLAASDDDMVEHLCRLVDDAATRVAIAEHNRTTTPAQTWATALALTDAAYARAQRQAEMVRRGEVGGPTNASRSAGWRVETKP